MYTGVTALALVPTGDANGYLDMLYSTRCIKSLSVRLILRVPFK